MSAPDTPRPPSTPGDDAPQTGDDAVDRVLAETAQARTTLAREDAGPEDLQDAADRIAAAHAALQERLTGGPGE